mmetsp:Transcript_9520/g.18300  ORF Transcript_9520/g.18300 Transcript_9520/m.18300 type:complete len:370 (-) Transcript_9520:1296-2405(-)
MCLPVSQRGLSAAKRSGCRSRMMLGVRVPILLYYFYSSITVVAFAGPHLTRIGRVITNMKKGKIPPPYAYNAPCPLCTVGPSSSCPMRNHHNPLSSSSSSSSSSTALTALPLWTAPVRLIALRGGEVSELATGAYEWCMNLGGPSALVAGAVIATIYENIGSGALDIDTQKDSKWETLGKRVARLLLLSAFALEVLSIFVTTVTGTMLLSHTEASLDALCPTSMVNKFTTPLSFLHDNFELEYLTARITFLQGLLNWLGAIALAHILPSGGSADSRAMNQFIGLSLILLMVVMMAFYNNHMNFYPNYATMLARWAQVCWQQFVWTWPPRPSIVFSVPLLCKTLQVGYLAFRTVPSASPKKKKEKPSGRQ